MTKPTRRLNLDYLAKRAARSRADTATKRDKQQLEALRGQMAETQWRPMRRRRTKPDLSVVVPDRDDLTTFVILEDADSHYRQVRQYGAKLLTQPGPGLEACRLIEVLSQMIQRDPDFKREFHVWEEAAKIIQRTRRMTKKV